MSQNILKFSKTFYSQPLQHSINIADCRGIIYDHSLEPQSSEVAGGLRTPDPNIAIQFFCTDILNYKGEGGLKNALNLDTVRFHFLQFTFS